MTVTTGIGHIKLYVHARTYFIVTAHGSSLRVYAHSNHATIKCDLEME